MQISVFVHTRSLKTFAHQVCYFCKRFFFLTGTQYKNITHRNFALLESDALIILFRSENSQYKTRWSRQAAEMIFFGPLTSWTNKKKIVPPILTTKQEQGEFRSYLDGFQVYFRMSAVPVWYTAGYTAQ